MILKNPTTTRAVVGVNEMTYVMSPDTLMDSKGSITTAHIQGSRDPESRVGYVRDHWPLP